MQDLQIGSLPLGMVVEQRFDQRFRQRQFTGDGHKIAPIQGGEECGEHGVEGRIPFEGIDEDIGIEIDRHARIGLGGPCVAFSQDEGLDLSG